MQAVGIQLSSALSALDQVGASIHDILCSHFNSLTHSKDYLQDQAAWVGQYIHLLQADVEPKLKSYDSRNLRFALTALAPIEAQLQALAAPYAKHRLAIVVGTSTSGIADNQHKLQQQKNQQQAIHLNHATQAMSSLAEALKIHLAWQGAAYAISTACSSSAKALAAGQRLLNSDLADLVLVGGVDTLCPLTLNGFHSLESLSSEICQPCGAARDGINIGEAAVFFVLTKQQAPVLLVSSGESMDAWHISAPHPEGLGAQRAMQQALAMANLPASEIDYLNLHGTATPQNDAMEIKAVQAVFGKHPVWLSSTKHKTGHCLGAAGAIEAYICQHILMSDQAWLPWHHAQPIDTALAGMNYVHSQSDVPLSQYVMSNSFAFGGSNISLIFGRGDV